MSGSSADPELARFAELNALAGFLPYQRRDELSALLTDADVATLKHLVAQGMGANSLRALASDLAYLERWHQAAVGSPLPWPAPEALVIKFVAHHLWDPVRRETDPHHGMPQEVAEALWAAGALKVEGPHAPATVRRRLALWSTLHHWRGLEGPFAAPQVRQALTLAVRAAARTPRRKSAKSVTADIVEKLLRTTLPGRLVDLRDRALILAAFGSGGRRRSEIARLRVEDIIEEPPVPARPGKEDSPLLPCRSLRLGRTKTANAEDDARVYLVGRPVVALGEWLSRSGIEKGPVFRAINKWGQLDTAALTPQAVNLILKKRVALAGLDPAEFSAHGLRSGYLTEAARKGVPIQEAMGQSQHRSVQQAARYYNDAERRLGRAARII
ncbi:site-specific integrase [Terrarubrum flagellatum]|uniref:site-specific integrase n=1 Tax=Terrirubrum flagellatum TaxID=2895980 RepID=UPI0031451FD2